MYPPAHHQEKDLQKMIAVIKQFPFGMLVTTMNGKPYITHIPIIYNEQSGKLVAHIDKFNPQLATLTNGAEVTIVFKGPDCYISPSVYTTKQLPTWNYIIVHITGTITLINEPNSAKDTMIAMTSFLEQPNPKFVLEKENKAMDRAVHYIQAFTITITNWEGKFKLSQDKNKQDQENAKQELIKKSRDLDSGFIEGVYE